MERPDGRVYEGEWKKNRQHGFGKFTDREGKTKDGIWDNGERVKWLDDKANFKRDDEIRDIYHDS